MQNTTPQLYNDSHRVLKEILKKSDELICLPRKSTGDAVHFRFNSELPSASVIQIARLNVSTKNIKEVRMTLRLGANTVEIGGGVYIQLSSNTAAKYDEKFFAFSEKYLIDVQSEEEFFQFSLLYDIGEIEFEFITDIKKIFQICLSAYKNHVRK